MNSMSNQTNSLDLNTSGSFKPFCRICQSDDDTISHNGTSSNKKSTSKDSNLITPCLCSGSLKHIHNKCLQRWVHISQNRTCELCKFPFKMKVKLKPLFQWTLLDLTATEKRRLVFSIIFHIIAMMCTMWSLYVLSERVVADIKIKDLSWPLWTKVLVIAIGLAGSLIFTYVQIRIYIGLIKRWILQNQKFIFYSLSETEIIKAKSELLSSLEKNKHTSIAPPGIFRQDSFNRAQQIVTNNDPSQVLILIETNRQNSQMKMRYLMSRLSGTSLNQVKQSSPNKTQPFLRNEIANSSRINQNDQRPSRSNSAPPGMLHFIPNQRLCSEKSRRQFYSISVDPHKTEVFNNNSLSASHSNTSERFRIRI